MRNVNNNNVLHLHTVELQSGEQESDVIEFELELQQPKAAALQRVELDL